MRPFRAPSLKSKCQTLESGLNIGRVKMNLLVFSEALTRHLAVEWGKDGVRTVCVAPGATRDTEGMRRLGEKMDLYMNEKLYYRKFSEI